MNHHVRDVDQADDQRTQAGLPLECRPVKSMPIPSRASELGKIGDGFAVRRAWRRRGRALGPTPRRVV
jgi:hypothetical protein